MIQTKGIVKSFGALKVLKGIDFNAGRSEVVSIMGASGAGKSTLLQILGSLSSPDAGSLVIDGVDVVGLKGKALADFRNRKVGFVFQFHHLLPEFTALENVMIPALIAGRARKEALKEAERLLTDMGLSERLDHKPSELSGGEQQRIVIARAILNKPELILADEPTGNLDVETGRRIVELLKEICAQGSAILMITHNLNLLSEYPGKVYRFADHHIEEISQQFSDFFEQNA